MKISTLNSICHDNGVTITSRIGGYTIKRGDSKLECLSIGQVVDVLKSIEMVDQELEARK